MRKWLISLTVAVIVGAGTVIGLSRVPLVQAKMQSLNHAESGQVVEEAGHEPANLTDHSGKRVPFPFAPEDRNEEIEFTSQQKIDDTYVWDETNRFDRDKLKNT